MKARKSLPVTALVLMLTAAACGRSETATPTTTTPSGDSTTSTAANKCSSEALKATEVGVSDSTITVTVIADATVFGTRPLFQANLDAMNAWAKHVNASGGVGCRKVVVNTVDSALQDPKTADGTIKACKDSLALVGGNSLFNTKAADMAKCVDKAGAATGLPDIAALANDTNEQCNTTTYVIQAVGENCPLKQGVRTVNGNLGFMKWATTKFPGLHGQFVVPGDLPSTRQSAPPVMKLSEKGGAKWDSAVLASQGVTQAGFGQFISQVKADKSTFVYNGSDDLSMIKYRKEAVAQRLEGIEAWLCSLSCYTKNFLDTGGSAVEGTYSWMQFLPFEEADKNAELKAYVDGVGADKVNAFGAQAWQSGVAFQTAVDKIVAEKGPNAITRGALLEELKGMKDFDANGWMGKKDLRGVSPCFLVMQVKDGKFVRVYPEEAGTFDCNESNLTTADVDPVAEAAKFK